MKTEDAEPQKPKVFTTVNGIVRGLPDVIAYGEYHILIPKRIDPFLKFEDLKKEIFTQLANNFQEGDLIFVQDDSIVIMLVFTFLFQNEFSARILAYDNLLRQLQLFEFKDRKWTTSISKV